MNKVIFAVLIYTSSISTEAQKFYFHKMNKYQNRLATWKLSSQVDNEHFAILDCQSLLHKLDIFSVKKGMIYENYLQIEICEAAREFFRKCIRTYGKTCLDTEDIYKSRCDCE